MNMVDDLKLHERDNGSPGVQIALLSEEIQAVAKHLRKHRKDDSARRGLLRMVGKRRRLLMYLERMDPVRYHEVIEVIGLDR